jgi:hypothetical protein
MATCIVARYMLGQVHNMTLDVMQSDATDTGIGFCSIQALKYP